MRILPGDHKTASAAKISAPMEAQQTTVTFGVPKASGQCFDGISCEVTIDLTRLMRASWGDVRGQGY
ncbi:hypothetical protein GOBAR_AA07924 [Gossypium barbadense]|uniref:Uncharacterized protein n=1 Tax=Gossypium barbadense TaxID=3634 RepID=A0A2P5YAX8_GOSBA|nr:hypothetical protein GOBAR_AA07924 [Gossypium barbadense]